MSDEQASKREVIAKIVTLRDDVQLGLQHHDDELRTVLGQLEQLGDDAARLYERDQIQKKLCKEMYAALCSAGIDSDRLKVFRRAMTEAGII